MDKSIYENPEVRPQGFCFFSISPEAFPTENLGIEASERPRS